MNSASWSDRAGDSETPVWRSRPSRIEGDYGSRVHDPSSGLQRGHIHVDAGAEVVEENVGNAMTINDDVGELLIRKRTADDLRRRKRKSCAGRVGLHNRRTECG